MFERGESRRQLPQALTIWSASLHNRILYVTTYRFCGADKIDYVRVRVRIGRETCAHERSTERGFQGAPPAALSDRESFRAGSLSEWTPSNYF